VALTAVVGVTVAASAAPATSTSTSASTMNVQSSGTHGCSSYDQCVTDQYTFRHYGFQVSFIYYCGAVAGCSTGWYSDW
jgi:hypothetical protein